ncbi:MAG TPA: hypothetical protein VN824_06190, partial [Puia sp.]|nr:hypothetical protein [Puia sp.]
TGKAMDGYMRNMQRTYIGAESDLVLSLNTSVSETETASAVRADLARIEREMTAALPRYAGTDREHLEGQIAAIKKILDSKFD